MFYRVLNVEHGENRAHQYFDPGFSVNLAKISRKAKKNTLLHRAPQSSILLNHQRLIWYNIILNLLNCICSYFFQYACEIIGIYMS